MMTKTTTITLVDDNGNDKDDVASTTKTKPIIIDLRNICQTFLKQSHMVFTLYLHGISHELFYLLISSKLVTLLNPYGSNFQSN